MLMLQTSLSICYAGQQDTRISVSIEEEGERMKGSIATGVAAVLTVLFMVSVAPAQDFGNLIDAVDKLETTLKAMVESESEARKHEIAELRNIVEQMPEGTAPSGDHSSLTQLALEVKALRADVDRLSSIQTTVPVTESDMLTIIGDIEYLKSQIGLLSTMTGETREQLASLDEDGFYMPPVIDPEVGRLTDRLVELNASLEEILSGKSGGTEPNPSVKHGKIVFSGLAHEHFLSSPDQTSSFISKRARFAVKGEINKYAQIKIQAEFAKSPKLLDGQVTISPHRQWSLSIGQYKPPFGTDFLTSASSTPFVNRSSAAGLGTNRDVGATVSFRHKFDNKNSLKLTTGLFNGAGINTSDVNSTKNFVAHLEAKLLDMFTLSPNVYAGKTNAVDSLKQDLVDFGGSLTWKWRHEIVEAEYVHSKHGDVERSGWYVWGGHSFAIGLGFLQEMQLLARYEQRDPYMGITGNRTDRLTLGTNLFIDEKYAKIQLNYHFNGEQEASMDNNEFLMNFQVAF